MPSYKILYQYSTKSGIKKRGYVDIFNVIDSQEAKRKFFYERSESDRRNEPLIGELTILKLAGKSD